MWDLATWQIWVTVLALLLSAVSFFIYVLILLASLKTEAAAKANAVTTKTLDLASSSAPATVSDLTDLVKAAAGLADSLAKAGPALWSLIASILFLAIAAISTGVLHGAPDGRSSAHEASQGTGDESNNASQQANSMKGVVNENMKVD